MIPSPLLLALAVLPCALGFGYLFAPGVLVPMLATDVALLLLAALDVAISRASVDARRSFDPVQAVGRPFEVTLLVRNRSRRRLRMSITDDAPGVAVGLPAHLRLPGGRQTSLVYEARVDRRGAGHFGPVTVRWRSVLGLWDRQVRLPVPDEVRVYPVFEQLRRYGLLARADEQRASKRAIRRAGGESEFERLRPYVPGDPYRHIDWRATARRGEFTTREYGQEANQNVIFLLDAGRMMSGMSGDLTAFDRALDAALTMGQVALRHGDRVGMLVFDREIRAWLPPRGGARSGSRLIRGTYDLFPTLFEPDYARAFEHLGTHVRRRSLVVLLTAVQDEVNAELATRLAAALGSRHLAVAVWLRDPDVHALLNGPSGSIADTWARCAAADLIARRNASLRAVRRRGGLVVDCPPDQLTAELLARYLEIKARRLL